MLQVAAGFNAPNVGVNINQRFVFRSLINHVRPQSVISFAVPVVILNAAFLTTDASVLNLAADVADHAFGLFQRRYRQALIGNHFRRHFAIVNRRCRLDRNIRNLGNIRFLIRIRINLFVHHQRPLILPFPQLMINNIKHIRAGINTRDDK